MGHKSKKTLERLANKPQRSQDPKQIRARARRAGVIMETEMKKLYKPLEEWDEEELARGRPRAKDGTFKGLTPDWVSREIHEETIRRFQAVVRGEMNAHTVKALTVMRDLLDNEETDDNGKALISGGTKADIAKFLLEHVVGKPTQRTETDISVRLQGILGMAMVPTGELTDSLAGQIIEVAELEEADG